MAIQKSLKKMFGTDRSPRSIECACHRKLNLKRGMKLGTKKRSLSPQEEDIIKDLYGSISTASLIKKLYKVSGHRRTEASVQTFAQCMGIKAATNNTENISLGEAAYLLQVNRNTIRELFNEPNPQFQVLLNAAKVNNHLKGGGGNKFLSLEQFDVLEQYYQAIPKGYMTITEAADMLGYTKANLSTCVKLGYIPGVRIRKLRYVESDTIQCVKQYLKESKVGRINWATFKTYKESLTK